MARYQISNSLSCISNHLSICHSAKNELKIKILIKKRQPHPGISWDGIYFFGKILCFLTPDYEKSTEYNLFFLMCLGVFMFKVSRAIHCLQSFNIVLSLQLAHNNSLLTIKSNKAF